MDAAPRYPGILRACADLLVAPSRLFRAIREDPHLAAPLLFLALGTGLLSLSIVTGPLLNDIQAQLEASEMSAAERAIVLEKLHGGWGYLTAAIPPIASALMPLVLAAILLLLLTVSRAVSPAPPVSYRPLASLAAHVSLVDLLEFLLKLPLFFAKGTMKVYSSAALLLPEEAADSRLFSFLDAFDLFTLWKLSLFTLGVSIVAGRGRGTSAAVVWIPWVLWVLGKTALHGVFSVPTGIG